MIKQPLPLLYDQTCQNPFYLLQACKTAVSSYFAQYRRDCAAYGFIPVMNRLTVPDESGRELLCEEALQVFSQHVDMRRLLTDLWMGQVRSYCACVWAIYMPGWADWWVIALL